ncbi:Copper chaperone for superoxide dismutase [Zea mays]|uniref:Copper chaperone for superoxide dismutase n=1 Tax=Zea mays TaxID=4577 RepID=A0A1D6E273_MAIZE|nr:Copper chaperone for superoxide dismutase [Zea mays]
MVGFLRAFAAASAVPAAAAAAYALFSSSAPSSSKLRFPLPDSFLSAAASSTSGRAPNAVPPMATAAATADLSAADDKQRDSALPELTVGIKNIEVDLSNQVVRVLGSLPVKTMLDALHQTGRDARLIGQGNPNDFLVSAAVAEFKGPVVFGVVRLAQVNMELARVEATFSGLSPGKHGWSINQFGDLTRGAESTGNVYNPPDHLSDKPLGDLGTLEAGENGEAHFSGPKEKLRVVDLIGRSIALYATEDRSDPGIAAAVIARSAGVGENYKKLCTCDGVTIWESS